MIADIDNDGDLDIVKALNINTTSDGGVLIWRNDGNAQFTEIARRSLIQNDGHPSPQVVALADPDRDGIPDVLRLGLD
ncbi:MAG TPA: VCBS repeat-containing protein, partial [Rhodocyclaceae bacterium]|nr:VCBS repeat-containing protein [Rhodocyclaceae bacterium]